MKSFETYEGTLQPFYLFFLFRTELNNNTLPIVIQYPYIIILTVKL